MMALVHLSFLLLRGEDAVKYVLLLLLLSFRGQLTGRGRPVTNVSSGSHFLFTL